MQKYNYLMHISFSELVNKMVKECVRLDLSNLKSKEIISSIIENQSHNLEDITEFHIIGVENIHFNINGSSIDENVFQELGKNIEYYLCQRLSKNTKVELKAKTQSIRADFEKDRFQCVVLVETEQFIMQYDCFLKWYSFYDEEKRTDYVSSNVISFRFSCLKVKDITSAFDFLVDNRDLLAECVILD